MSSKYDDAESRLNEYEVVKKIGNGRFGEVFLVKHKKTQEFFCWKAISYRGLKEREKTQLVIEVNVMRELKHKNIVRYIDRFLNKANQKLYILMEFCDAGDLSRNIQKCYKMFGKIEEHAIIDITRQLLHALAYCHNLKDGPNGEKVLHRDLKPQNIFLSTGIRHVGKITAQANNLTTRPIAKIGDFGLSKNIGIESMAHSCVGTPYYWSPELLLHETKSYDDKSDMWALGCIIYELCSGKSPFHKANNFGQLVSELKKGPELPIKGKSKELNMLIKNLLNLSAKERPSALQCLGYEIIKEINPINRKENIEKISINDKNKCIDKNVYNINKKNIDPNYLNKDTKNYEDNYNRVNNAYNREGSNLYEIEKEKRKIEMLKREQIERNKIEKEQSQRKNMEMKLMEQKHLERLEKEKIEKEKIERERIERLRIERLEREKIKRLERERMERLERERMERLKREKLERERIEMLERERIERLERERMERLERERMERLEREKIERLEREKMERLEREKIERLEREKIERLERKREKEIIDRKIIDKNRIERDVMDDGYKYYIREMNNNNNNNNNMNVIGRIRNNSKHENDYKVPRMQEKYETINNMKNYDYKKIVDSDEENNLDKRNLRNYIRKESINSISNKNIQRQSNASTRINSNYNPRVDNYSGYTKQSNLSQYSNNSMETSKYKIANKNSKENMKMISKGLNDDIDYKDREYEKDYNACKSSRISNIYFNNSGRRSISVLTHMNNSNENKNNYVDKEYINTNRINNKKESLENDRGYLLEKRKLLLEKDIYERIKPNDYVNMYRNNSKYGEIKNTENLNHQNSKRNRSMSINLLEAERRNSSYYLKNDSNIEKDKAYYMMKNKNIFDIKKNERNEYNRNGLYL